MSKRKKSIPEVVSVRICKGATALTAAKAKELIGWSPTQEGEEVTLKDFQGNKITCTNNLHNRPIYQQNCYALLQEIARRRYVFNGEPIIVGKGGTILNGQHTLIALILLVQDWEKNSYKYDEYWESEPTIDKLIVYGVDESDTTVNTMDTCKPRTLADVVYRSEFFKDLNQRERKQVSRICSFAIKAVWERTGASNAFAPRQTHSEAMAFISSHPRLLEAVKFTYFENVESSLSRFLPLGYLSGLLYLMGTSNSDSEEYSKSPCESNLDFSNWDLACEFFVYLSSGSAKTKVLSRSLGKILEEYGYVSRRERIALIAHAWQQYVTSGKVKKIELQYKVVEGLRVLVDPPNVGGIDLL